MEKSFVQHYKVPALQEKDEEKHRDKTAMEAIVDEP